MDKKSYSRIITDRLPQKLLLAISKLNLKKSYARIHQSIILYLLLNLMLLFITLTFFAYQLTKTYFMEKDKREEVLKEALYWERITKEHSNYPDAYFKAATYYYRLKDQEKALELLDKALLLDPGFKEAEKLRNLILPITPQQF